MSAIWGPCRINSGENEFGTARAVTAAAPRQPLTTQERSSGHRTRSAGRAICLLCASQTGQFFRMRRIKNCPDSTQTKTPLTRRAAGKKDTERRTTGQHYGPRKKLRSTQQTRKTGSAARRPQHKKKFHRSGCGAWQPVVETELRIPELYILFTRHATYSSALLSQKSKSPHPFLHGTTRT